MLGGQVWVYPGVIHNQGLRDTLQAPHPCTRNLSQEKRCKKTVVRNVSSSQQHHWHAEVLWGLATKCATNVKTLTSGLVLDQWS